MIFLHTRWGGRRRRSPEITVRVSVTNAVPAAQRGAGGQRPRGQQPGPGGQSVSAGAHVFLRLLRFVVLCLKNSQSANTSIELHSHWLDNNNNSLICIKINRIREKRRTRTYPDRRKPELYPSRSCHRRKPGAGGSCGPVYSSPEKTSAFSFISCVFLNSSRPVWEPAAHFTSSSRSSLSLSDFISWDTVAWQSWRHCVGIFGSSLRMRAEKPSFTRCRRCRWPKAGRPSSQS